jgi:Kef-type K+ transport system membrane component KefB
MASRRFSLTLLILVATPWAALLTLAGLWLLLGTSDHATPGPWPRVVGGITATSAGMLVFMCLVADRLFPRASRPMVASIEVATSLIVFMGIAWLSVMLANLLAPAS